MVYKVHVTQGICICLCNRLAHAVVTSTPQLYRCTSGAAFCTHHAHVPAAIVYSPFSGRGSVTRLSVHVSAASLSADEMPLDAFRWLVSRRLFHFAALRQHLKPKLSESTNSILTFLMRNSPLRLLYDQLVPLFAERQDGRKGREGNGGQHQVLLSRGVLR